MRFSAPTQAARLLAGITLVVLTAAAGQEPASKADEQALPEKQITGTVASMNHRCTFFTLRTNADGQTIEVTFQKDRDRGSWVLEPGGCNIVFSNEEKVLLRPGTKVTVRYVVQDGNNLVRGFVLPRAKAVESISNPPPVHPDDSMVNPSPPSSSPGKIYHIGNGVAEPKCIYCPSPPYDRKSRSKRVQGTVILTIVILPDGTVSDARVVQSLNKGLNKSALETARKYRFAPIIGPEGNPVKVQLTVEMNFRVVY